MLNISWLKAIFANLHLLVIGVLGAYILSFLLTKISKLNNVEIVKIRHYFIILMTVVFALAVLNLKFYNTRPFVIFLYVIFSLLFLSIFLFPTTKNPIIDFCYLFLLKAYGLEKFYSEIAVRLLGLFLLIWNVVWAIKTKLLLQ